MNRPQGKSDIVASVQVVSVFKMPRKRRFGRSKPISTSSNDYEFARSRLEREWEEVSHDFGMVMDSMGWRRGNPSVIACAQQYFNQNLAWTEQDVRDIAELVASARDPWEDNAVQDGLSNLIAEYMLKALKHCGWRK